MFQTVKKTFLLYFAKIPILPQYPLIRIFVNSNKNFVPWVFELGDVYCISFRIFCSTASLLGDFSISFEISYVPSMLFFKVVYFYLQQPNLKHAQNVTVIRVSTLILSTLYHNEGTFLAFSPSKK